LQSDNSVSVHCSRLSYSYSTFTVPSFPLPCLLHQLMWVTSIQLGPGIKALGSCRRQESKTEALRCPPGLVRTCHAGQPRLEEILYELWCISMVMASDICMLSSLFVTLSVPLGQPYRDMCLCPRAYPPLFETTQGISLSRPPTIAVMRSENRRGAAGCSGVQRGSQWGG
jgi:hypothetical protein